MSDADDENFREMLGAAGSAYRLLTRALDEEALPGVQRALMEHARQELGVSYYRTTGRDLGNFAEDQAVAFDLETEQMLEFLDWLRLYLRQIGPRHPQTTYAIGYVDLVSLFIKRLIREGEGARLS